MRVFTTRADTIMGVTFCAVAPEHPLATHAAQGNARWPPSSKNARRAAPPRPSWRPEGKRGHGHRPVRHPSLDRRAVEVWVGNYVLMSYGDGAVMGVPAHDERDFAFALKYDLEIEQVILVDGEHFDHERWQDWYADKERGVTINSDNFSGLAPYKDAVAAVAAALAAKGLGELKTTWRLRDWGISRQRYWGTPILIIHCADCGAQPVPEKDLPVVLPAGSGARRQRQPAGQKRAVSRRRHLPLLRQEPAARDRHHGHLRRQSWYFMRYCDAKNHDAMVGAGTDYWMRDQNADAGMDQYIGGIEHAILHLLVRALLDQGDARPGAGEGR